MQYELSDIAEDDLENIFLYTLNNFGIQQAAKYIESFEPLFEKICSHPKLGIERNEIRKGLRSTIKESHVVFYRILSNRIRIVRILHGSRDLPKFF